MFCNYNTVFTLTCGMSLRLFFFFLSVCLTLQITDGCLTSSSGAREKGNDRVADHQKDGVCKVSPEQDNLEQLCWA